MGKRRVKKISNTISIGETFHLFFIAHWRGIMTIIVPFLVLPVVFPFPGQAYNWVAYTLLVMGIYWVTECIPVAITGFIPIIIFPITDVLPTRETCETYMNDTIMMYIGSLYLASSVEQSGFHQRLVYFAMRVIGYSHMKLLAALCICTTFVSMWITNTAATVMMVPINFGILKVFEEQGVLKIYDVNDDGDLQASDLTTCYFCAATYSATVGGIGTLVGTGTNLVFKGLFMAEYPTAPEYLSFPLFSAFAVPYMILMELAVYLYLVVVYFGTFRKGSPEAIKTAIQEDAKMAAKGCIEKKSKALGSITFHETMVMLIFSATMVMFFCRSPQIFTGWADIFRTYFDVTDPKFILDSALCMISTFILMAIARNVNLFRHCTPKYIEDMPKEPIRSLLDWSKVNRELPYSFMFLLGGGFALSTAAKSSGLNDKLGESLKAFQSLPISVVMLAIIIVVIFITNFASNVAVANVLVPICMTMAREIGYNPLWFCVIAGFCASYCFLLPVGTPGNLVVQSAAKIPTRKMIKAGAGPTLATIVLSWIAFYFWCPVIWPDVSILPEWASAPPAT